MTKLLKPTLLVLALLALPARAELVDRVVAVVNNDVITQTELETRIAPDLQRLRGEPDPKRRGDLREQLLKKGLDVLIGEKLMEAQIRDLNIEVTDAEVDLSIEDVKRQANMEAPQFEAELASAGFTMATYRVFMKQHLSKMKLVNLKVRSKMKISDEDLKAEYAKVAHDESSDFEVHARHMLVQVAPKATPEQVEAARVKAAALAAEARKPGADFAELAKKKSEGPSAAEGGDLGFFKRGVMVGDFEKAAFSLPVGGVSDPIRTKFGWHVIRIEERRTLAARPYEDMKEELREKLLRAQLEKYTDQYVQELRAAAVVENKL